MPPASPAATSVERSASSSEVLPWSTWPMTVTTGGRGHQFRLGVDGALQAHLHVGFRDAARAVAEFLHHQFGGVGIQRLRDGRHDAELHQRLDHLAGARGHAVGEFLHRDGVRQNDVAHDLHLIGAQPLQFCLAAFALALAAHRGQRADAFVLALDRRLHVDAAGAAARIGALLGDDGLRLARHHDAAGAADRPRLVLLLHAACRGAGAASRSASPAWRPAAGAARSRLSARRVGAARRRGRRPDGCRRGLGRLARQPPRLPAAPRLRPPGGLPLPRPCAPLPRAGAPPRRPTGWRSSPARAAPPRASRPRAAARPARAGAPPARSPSGREATAVTAGRSPGVAPARAVGAVAPGAAVPPGDAPGAPTGARFLRTSTCTTFERPWLKLCRTDPASTVRPSSRRPAGRSESRPLPVS